HQPRRGDEGADPGATAGRGHSAGAEPHPAGRRHPRLICPARTPRPSIARRYTGVLCGAVRIAHWGDTMRISRVIASLTAAAALVAGTLIAASSASATVTTAPPPSKMAALGDSITQAAMTCSALTSCPANSWSTGTTTAVQSHYLRLKAKNPVL